MLAGPRLLSLIALATGAMWLAIAISVSPAEAAAGAVIRWTARTSLVLFALAYIARPLVQLHPTPATKSLLAQRKWLGLGFATSHGLHLAGILWLASRDFGAFVRSQEPTILVAVATFVFLGIMAVTSFDAVRRAMPTRTWRRLHWTGMQLAWLSFTATYAGAIAVHPLYALPAALLLGAAAIRTAAWARGRRRRVSIG
ncbi:MAG TPA: ferric reductase-like transmembrane domain-containing protein [Kofleriaceae bacterium]|nr:ferric reductase-like transmembrane domain-containing protein [Kofleriaceae bacterium]